MDYEKLKALMLKYDKDSIRHEKDEWIVTTDWLVGCICGRAFVSKELNTALEEMCEYLERHIGHDSLVGLSVTNSRFPRLDEVERYISEYTF